MKIAFVTAASAIAHEDYENGKTSGTESQVFNVAKYLVGKGHNVSILRRNPIGDGETKTHGINVIDISSPAQFDDRINYLNKLVFSRRARARIKALDPDIVNVIMKYASFFTCTLDRPIVHFAFNNPAQITPDKSSLARICTSLVENRIANNVDTLVVRNERNKSHLRELGVDATVRKIPCGIDTAQYAGSGEEFIFYGGRFSDEKRVLDLVRAYAGLPADLRAAYPLKLVGEGPLEDEIREASAREGIREQVLIEPWLETDAYISQLGRSVAYVLPSLYEGLPVALLEAMACSKPVVGTTIPGIKDVIDHGKTGLLYEPKDVSQLTDYLETILIDEETRREMGRAARQEILNHYTFDHIVDQYLSIYKSITDN